MTLDAFLALPWSDSMRQTLRAKAESTEVQYLAAWRDADRLKATAYATRPDAWPDTTVMVWCRALPVVPDVSKTQQAVDLVNAGMTPFAAAKQLGIHPSAVYRAMTRAEEKPLCPCCRQVVREGFTVDTSVLKPRAAETSDA